MHNQVPQISRSSKKMSLSPRGRGNHQAGEDNGDQRDRTLFYFGYHFDSNFRQALIRK